MKKMLFFISALCLISFSCAQPDLKDSAVTEKNTTLSAPGTAQSELAAVQWYFRGTPNSWQAAPMEDKGGGIYETVQTFANGDADGKPRFKIDRWGNWNENYPSTDREVTAYKTYRITFNSNSKYINVQEETGPGKDMTIYVEKQANWNQIWIWYDKNSDGLWETGTLKSPPGDLVQYRTGWYKKTIENCRSVTYLFNDGTWNNKLSNGGADFVTTGDVWITKDGKQHTSDPFTGEKERLITINNFYSSSLGNSRTIRVYLPESYYSGTKSYPVIYMQDGQNVFKPGGQFGCWNVEDALNGLVTDDKINEVIVVGIDNSSNRTNEYNYGAGGIVEKYADFVIDEIIPHINANYRTQTGPENTAIMGSSYGGMCSLYLAWNNPAVFGNAGIFSSTLAWNNFKLLDEIKAYTGPKKSINFWVYAGDSEKIDPDGNGIRNYAEWNHDLAYTLLEKGWQNEVDFLYEIGEGEDHNEAAWSKYVSKPVQFFFGKNNTFNVNRITARVTAPVLYLDNTVETSYLLVKTYYENGLTAQVPHSSYSLSSGNSSSFTVKRGILSLSEWAQANRTTALHIGYKGKSTSTSFYTKSSSANKVRVDFQVTAPDTSGEVIYIVGNYCGWSFGINTVYTLTLDHSRDGKKYYTGYAVFDKNQAVSFKFCSGPDWSYEELTSWGQATSNRSLNTGSNNTYYGTVARWRNTP